LIVSLLVAVDFQWGIGRDGRVPWHLRADLQLFKRLTMGHHILMGRKTFESIGRPLSGRQNLVLTRDKNWQVPGVIAFDTMFAALEYGEQQAEKELFVIGGGEVFSQTLSAANRIYLTRVQTNADCSVFFPEMDQTIWRNVEIGFHPNDAKNDHAFIFSRFERILPSRP
jgi:dihydrofolate reductase